jgi:hypothetical protein
LSHSSRGYHRLHIRPLVGRVKARLLDGQDLLMS